MKEEMIRLGIENWTKKVDAAHAELWGKANLWMTNTR